MLFLSKEKIEIKFYDLINNYILSQKNSEDSEKINEFNALYESIEDISIFFETAFSLSDISEDEYKKFHKSLKEIEVSFIAHKIKEIYGSKFKIKKRFKYGQIKEIKSGCVFLFQGEVYISKSVTKMTSKGYQVIAKFILEGDYSFSNSIYIDTEDKSFIVIGLI